MKNLTTKLSLFINYFVFAILLNSVGTVILQVQNSYGVTESDAAILEAYKDLSIAVTSFLVASFLVRLGYKRSMLIALGAICLVCLMMPYVPTFWMTKLMFAATGICFALVKMSVYAALGLVTKDSKEHVSTMNFLESFFMVGVLSGYFFFGAFIDDFNPGSESWLNVYYLLAVLSFLAFTLLALVRLDESSVASTEEKKSIIKDFMEMLKLCITPLVMIFVISAFLYVLIEQSIMSWLPTFNSKILNLSASLSIQMTSILATFTALGRFIGGVVFQYIHWFKALCVGLVLAGILVLVTLPLVGNVAGQPIDSWFDAPLVAYVFPMIGLCIAPVYPAINSVILSALPTHQHASMAGLIVLFSALGGTSGSIVTGTLFEHFGGKPAFYCSLIPIGIILFTLYLFKRKTDEVMCAGGVNGVEWTSGDGH